MCVWIFLLLGGDMSNLIRRGPDFERFKVLIVPLVGVFDYEYRS